MAKGKKTGGRNFKKGQSGNPNGPAPLSPEARAFKNLTREGFETIANKYLSATRDEIRAALQDPSMKAIELAVISVINQAIKGEGRMLDLLLTRLIGKVTQPLEHSGPDGGAIQIRASQTNLSPEEKRERLKKIQARINRTLGHEK